MATQERKRIHQQHTVLDILGKRKSLSTTDAANFLNVSESTIRRLFDELERNGDVIRIYGGIIPASRDQNEYTFENLKMKQADEKQRIGLAASQLVNNGETLFIDSGTTAQQMALSLAKRLKAEEVSNVHVFTNSMINVEVLADCCEVNLLGGLYRKNRQDFCGYITDIVLDVISFDKSFFGADAIFVSIDGGASASDIFTAQISRKVVGRTKENYIIADSTKFNTRSLIQFISMNQMHMIITDQYFPESMTDSVENVGPKLLRV